MFPHQNLFYSIFKNFIVSVYFTVKLKKKQVIDFESHSNSSHQKTKQKFILLIKIIIYFFLSAFNLKLVVVALWWCYWNNDLLLHNIMYKCGSGTAGLHCRIANLARYNQCPNRLNILPFTKTSHLHCTVFLPQTNTIIS